ncbi:MAG: hypothetical protein NT165_04065 [Candidatus Falkowbacteria bacterium]|nr:hypothetical protein [Candidatus Falkowbacteria bacterium]
MRKLLFLKSKFSHPRFLWLVLLFVFVGFFAAGVANASIGTAIATFIGWIIYGIVWALGQLLVLMMSVLVWIAQWKDFITAPAVTLGWKIVRDICNMFFVVIMLVIAFATVLRIENYSYQKLLPKLIVMAILINFSKMICGVIIDVSQVVMLTFVNSFKDVAGGNLTNILGLDKLFSMGADAADGNDVSGWSILGAYVLALIYVIIALIVVIVMVVMLAIRIVMIWIYVVLSPAAYLLGAFPAGQKYASQWWSEFTSNIIIGPVLAFFIWLSFAALGAAQPQQDLASGSALGTGTGGNEALTEAGSPDHMLQFVISIAMLVGGLQIAQKIGGAAGGVAGKGMNAINKGRGMATKGLIAAGGAVAYGTIANKYTAPITKNTLGRIASQSGVTGRILGAVGVRGLAGKGLIAFNQQQKKIEEKAQKKMEGFKDTRVVARYAREGAFTPSGTAAQKKAGNMMPSALYENTPASRQRVEQKLAGMTREDLAKLSDAEWHAIGATGADLTGRAIGYIQKNSDDRGAYNLGRSGQGDPPVAGTGADGNALAGPDVYGSYYRRLSEGTLHADEVETLERTGIHSTQYLREEDGEPVVLEPEQATRVSGDNQNAPRGKGNLAINEVARGSSSTVAVDFDKLNLAAIDKGKDADWKNTRGFNTSDQQLVGQIASKMLEVINQEKGRLVSKGTLNIGEQKRLGSLNKAEEYFKSPEKINELSMLNSSAAKFQASDVKETKIHEEMHGIGYGEADVRSATSSIMENRNYGARHDRGQIDSILAENNQRSSEPKKSASEVNQKESAAKIEMDTAAKTGSSEINTADLEKVIDRFSQKMDEISKQFSGGAKVTDSSGKVAPIGSDNVSLFKNLNQTILSANNKLGNKIAMLGGSKATSPLEVDVIYKETAGEK